MDLVLLTENDIILTDIQYSFTKNYPYIMIHFFDDNDVIYDANKYLFEIAKYRNEAVIVTKDSTIEEIQYLYYENFGIHIKIAGFRDNEAVYIDSSYTLEEIDSQLRDIEGFKPYPIYNIGLRVFPDSNNKEKMIVKHLDGEEVIIDESLLKKDANNVIILKDKDGIVYAIDAITMEVISKKKFD
jgi:hypothetical protein